MKRIFKTSILALLIISLFFKNINRIMSLSGIEFERYNNNFYLSKKGLYKTQKYSIGGIR